jgi:hypothetical protein
VRVSRTRERQSNGLAAQGLVSRETKDRALAHNADRSLEDRRAGGAAEFRDYSPEYRFT